MNDTPGKKPSGYQYRKARKEADAAAAEREQDRGDITTRLKDRVAQFRAEPYDALGNQRFANNVARALAEALLEDESIPLEVKAKLVADQLDRVAATHSKALNAERIEELQRKAGVKKPPKADAARVIPINGSGSLRAGSRIQSVSAVSGSMPDVPPKADE